MISAAPGTCRRCCSAPTAARASCAAARRRRCWRYATATPAAPAALEPARGVVLYTDGLVERRREPIDESLERLRRGRRGLRRRRSTRCATTCLERCAAPPGARHDDIALIACRACAPRRAPRSGRRADRMVERDRRGRARGRCSTRAAWYQQLARARSRARSRASASAGQERRQWQAGRRSRRISPRARSRAARAPACAPRCGSSEPTSTSILRGLGRSAAASSSRRRSEWQAGLRALSEMSAKSDLAADPDAGRPA